MVWVGEYVIEEMKQKVSFYVLSDLFLQIVLFCN